MRRALFAAVLALAGCGDDSAVSSGPPKAAEERDTVFDPLTSSLDRAEDVQKTLDAQAAEQRRRIEEAER